MRILTTILKGLFVVFVGFLLYFPIIIIAILSVNDSSRAHEFTAFSLDWYVEIFTDRTLFEAIRNTWLIAIISTAVSTVVGTLTAIGIVSLTKRMKRTMMFLNNIPIVNPDIVTGISLMIIFSIIGIKFGFTTMLLAHVFFSIPYVVLTVLPKLRSIDKNLYDAAIDLGCNPACAIIKVIVPAIQTGIVAGALIAFTMSIDDFVISYFTTGNGFTNFSNWIYARLGRKTFSPAAYAYNTLITTVTIMVLIVINIRSAMKQKRAH